VSALSDSALERLRGALAGAEEEERYELLEELGRGGMGTVYRAVDKRLAREVALKVVEESAEPETAARLLHEAVVIARLEHPGIVPVHDRGRLRDGRLFYAMKLVQGRRLDELLASGLALTEALAVFERLAQAVAFAHAHGVVHRDLKPENVMVGSFGEVLVMDWGIAKVLSDSDPPAGARATGADGPGTAHGTVLGTPGYMAPEQERGETSSVDARTDVWALGAILRGLLQVGAPRPLLAVAAKAMSERPADRYADAADLAAEIAHFRAGAAVGAYRESLPERLLRFGRRYRLPIVLVIAYLVMRVVIALAFKGIPRGG